MHDVIIVGAGSAGAVLAARLSDDPARSVLLLEAGPDHRSDDAPPEMASPNPVGLLRAPHSEHFLWAGLTARHSSRQEPRTYWRGRGMGGSSAVNGEIAIRGVPDDYDRWAELGCDGWAWDDVAPAFNRLEDDLDFGDAPYHGRGGPLPIYRATPETMGPVDNALLRAALDLGYPWNPDHNAPTGSGVSPYAINSRNGARVSTNDGYLEPARGRENLTMWGNALVEKVLFDGRRAIGVRVRMDGEWVDVAGREIILAAGAIHSPAILLRSGVGPAAQLRSLSIPLVRDLPVGENLQEHPGVNLELRLRPEGRVSSRDFRHTNCVVRYASGMAGAGENDMILVSHNLTGYDDTAFEQGILGARVFQAFSQGRLALASPDPDEHPLIDLRLLSDERDLLRLRDGAQRLFVVARHPAVTAIAETVTLGRTDGWAIDDLSHQNDLDDWLLTTVSDTQHPVGTCRIGPPGDPRAVVDPECRVAGLTGLRVIDGSIMPEVPRANTHLTCVMIGEHMASRLARSLDAAGAGR